MPYILLKKLLLVMGCNYDMIAPMLRHAAAIFLLSPEYILSAYIHFRATGTPLCVSSHLLPLEKVRAHFV
jgi:hypothetical protein